MTKLNHLCHKVINLKVILEELIKINRVEFTDNHRLIGTVYHLDLFYKITEHLFGESHLMYMTTYILLVILTIKFTNLVVLVFLLQSPVLVVLATLVTGR